MTAAPKLSGLQRQVLSLARQLFRAARAQPAPVRAAVSAEVRAEFARYAHVARGDVARIEHLLRRGAKHLDTLRSPHFRGVQQVAPQQQPRAP